MFKRELAAHGIDTWATITNANTRKWLTWPETQKTYNMPDNIREQYNRLITELNTQPYTRTQTDIHNTWHMQTENNEANTLGGIETQNSRGRGRPRKGEKPEKPIPDKEHVDTIIASRRTPTCVGGWEYLIKWKDTQGDGTPHKDTWEPETQLILGNEMKDNMERARGDNLRRPATFGEWLDIQTKRGDTRCTGVQQHCKNNQARQTRAEKTNSTWSNTWKLFLEYAAQKKNTYVHNIKELPARAGRNGGEWTCTEHTQTNYLGEHIAYKEPDGTMKTKRIMSLTPCTDKDREISNDLRVTRNTIQKRIDEDAQYREHNSENTTIPPNYPLHEVNSTDTSTTLFKTVHPGEKGYTLINDADILKDPVLRTFLRSDELEARTGTIRLKNGKLARMDRRERRLMGERRSTYTSADAARIAIALHFRHHFTHAAAVDGSKAGEKEDENGIPYTNEEAEEMEEELRLGACAYGYWEGPRFGKTTPTTATTREVNQAIQAGMGGGKLPDSWSIADAEVYAVLAYLKRVVDEPNEEGRTPTPIELKERRTLIMSDCIPAMHQIENAWRLGHVEGMRRWDRGGMLEAINNIRTQLGEVVMLWTPSHTGISPNAYADNAAKTYLQRAYNGATEQTSKVVCDNVQGRPCLYEISIGEGENKKWELMDRPAFKACRLRGRRYVRGQLEEGIRDGACIAGQTAPLWKEVAAKVGKKPKEYKPYNKDQGETV